jgi:hypothetical protein
MKERKSAHTRGAPCVESSIGGLLQKTEVTRILTLWSHSADRRRSTSLTRPLELP